MARLLLLRHAKSSWGEPGLADIDRPLAPRGRHAAALMAKAIADRGLIPDLILCSPARRTRDTLAPLEPFLGPATRVVVTGDLYEPPSGDYRDAIGANGDDAGALMLVGHNPATHATALLLAGIGDPKLIADIGAKYPTGALAVIDFETSGWTKLRPRSGRLAAFITPRSLEGGAPGDDDD